MYYILSFVPRSTIIANLKSPHTFSSFQERAMITSLGKVHSRTVQTIARP